MTTKVARLMLGAVLSLLPLAETASAATVTIPAQLATVEGNTSNSEPLGAEGPARHQTVVSQSGLAGLVPGSKIIGVRFRVDSAQTSLPPQTVANFELRLSRSLNPPGSLDPIFANNRGADEVIVRSGPLVINAGDYPGGSSPNAFGPLIAFSQPYVYTGGPLLIEGAQDGYPSGGRYSDNDFPSAISETRYAAGFGATTGNVGPFQDMIVTQFEIAPAVPAVEPWGLAILGALLILAGAVATKRL